MAYLLAKVPDIKHTDGPYLKCLIAHDIGEHIYVETTLIGYASFLNNKNKYQEIPNERKQEFIDAAMEALKREERHFIDEQNSLIKELTNLKTFASS